MSSIDEEIEAIKNQARMISKQSKPLKINYQPIHNSFTNLFVKKDFTTDFKNYHEEQEMMLR